MTVVWILVPLFLFVGIWLFVFNRKKSALIRQFAQKRGLKYKARSPGLDDELDRAFHLDTPYARGFMLVKDIVFGRGVRLFRVTELLDLSRYTKAQNTHFPRVAAYFDAPDGDDVYFKVSRGGWL